MQYFGGKARISKQIVGVLKSLREDNELFVEPFCGGLNITCLMGGDVLANDKNYMLISLYQSMLDGWVPPDSVSEDEYNYYKLTSNPANPHMCAFVGIGCSYSGKWFGGYARDKHGRNYAMNAKNSLIRKINSLPKNIKLTSVDYYDIRVNSALIYCDPPYANSTGYMFGKFDSDKFWDWCREMSKTNTVVISEYIAPDDFECILSINTMTDIRTCDGKSARVEKLFKLKQ